MGAGPVPGSSLSDFSGDQQHDSDLSRADFNCLKGIVGPLYARMPVPGQILASR